MFYICFYERKQYFRCNSCRRKIKRFGEDKSLKKLGKYTLLEHTVLKIEKFFSELLIISNNSELKFKQKNIFIIDDYIKGNLGPLVGVLSAMKWIKKMEKNMNGF